MRPAITCREYLTYTYQSTDRPPDFEFGFWPQTVRRWMKEGFSAALSEADINAMFNATFDRAIGLDPYEPAMICSNCSMIPGFEEKIIEKTGESVIFRDTEGVIAQRFLNTSDESSIPHFLEFPVKNIDDWQEMKKRYEINASNRRLSDAEILALRENLSEGRMSRISFVGFYAIIRQLMGFENAALAFCLQPELVGDIVDHWASLLVAQIEALPADIPVDFVEWWEDMAGRNGPFVGPEMFREFLQPGYKRVMAAAKKRGCLISHVDCDGDPSAIVGNWLEEGVNVMFPLEQTAGVDGFAWRKKFGKSLRLRGGIAKEPLVQGGAAIDRELERIKPLLDDGGYIPHLDHLIPPDISYKNYMEYREKKMKLIGKL